MKNSNTLSFNGQTIALKSTNLVDLQKELSSIRDSFFSELATKALEIGNDFTIDELHELGGGNLKPAQIQYYCNKSKALGFNIEKNVNTSSNAYYQVDRNGKAIPGTSKTIEEKTVTYFFS